MINEGDKVSRQINIGEPERRYGVIVNKYKSRQGRCKGSGISIHRQMSRLDSIKEVEGY